MIWKKIINRETVATLLNGYTSLMARNPETVIESLHSMVFNLLWESIAHKKKLVFVEMA
jgi:hypothetical protein